MSRYPVLLFLLLALPVPSVLAQDAVQPNWRQADRFAQENLRKFIYSTSVSPNWVGKTDRFWYQYRTSAGTQYWLVDAERQTKKPLFDHAALAASLSAATRKPHEAVRLDLTGLRLDDAVSKLEFASSGRRFEYELANGKLTDKGPAPARPDSRPGSRPAGENLNINEEEQRRRLDDLTQQQRQEFLDQLRNQEQQDQQQNVRQNEQQEQQQNQQQQNQQNQQRGRGQGGGAPGGGGPRDPRAFAPDRSTYAFLKEHDLYVVEGVEERVEAEEATASRASPESAPAEANASRPASRPRVEATPSDDANGTASRPSSRPADEPPRPPRYKFDESTASRLTRDGAEGYSFGGGGGPGAPPAAPGAPPSVTWSKNSKAFYGTRRDTRGVADLWLVDSIAQPRPTLQKYSYAMPGEERVVYSELWVFDRGQKQARQVQRQWVQESYQNPHFVGNTTELRFVRRDRLQRNAEVCTVDPSSGAVRVLFRESLENASLDVQTPRYLEKRKQFLWFSERTGYGHFYLHNSETGAEILPVTSGTFRANRILEVDEDAGVVWFRGKGREPKEDLNYEHLYRVDLDGKGLMCLDPGDAHHASTLSPSRRYVVDNFSRIDLPGRSVLRDGRDGRLVLELETCDVSKLAEMGWKAPERFTVKAADGITDLYGNMWKPFDFNPSRKYPMIVHVYPGPQREGVTHAFTAGGVDQQLAQLGFVVVEVGHRGGTPERSKAYASYGYGNLRDYGLEDKKAALEQLGDRHKFIDIERIGIFGHSGGGFMTAAALLQEPYNRFFKVGVSSAGNHDNNIYNQNWSERWHGLKEVPASRPATGAESRASESRPASRGATEQGRVRVDGQQREGLGSRRGGRRGGGGEGSESEDLEQGEDDMDEAAQESRRVESRGTAQQDQGGAAAGTKFEIKVPTNAELAAGLQGRLLLVHGEIDNNVHPANTMRLVDALIRANKRFDLLIIPGARHGFGHANGYFQQRMFEYFVEHLLGEKAKGADILRK